LTCRRYDPSAREEVGHLQTYLEELVARLRNEAGEALVGE
jgi:hypothetical protein